jgi:two-component system, chemotaxis family, protein-glutamate methylesterase/glutaminase
MAATSETVTRELLPRIRALCHLPVSLTADAGTQEVPLAPPLAVRPKHKPPLIAPVQIVTIGVSTGGPDALARLLPSLPANLPVPVVIAQHMPPIFTSLLAARLSARCSLPVRECKSGENLTAGCVFIAPGDFHMVTCSENGVVRLKTHQGPKENFCRPSVDVLFRSVADVYGARTLAVILTGMGQDGLKGCELLSGVGARILAQDEASSVVWGMPGFVARSGLADKILPLDQIGAEIVRATTMQIAARAQS